MPLDAYQILGCTLLVHRGSHFQLGDLELLVCIDGIGIEVPQFTERTRVAVLARNQEGALVEVRTQGDPLAIARLVAALRTVRFPEVAPELEAIDDTGDGWERLRLLVHLDGQSSAMELHLHSSGFSGKDASQWRLVFNSILRMADQLGDVAPPWACADGEPRRP